jgi:acyl-[acyl-carrier-protein] desaturase
LDDVVRPVLRFWRVFERDDLDGDGERARNELAAFLDLVEDKAAHYEQRRQERLAGAGVAISAR